MTLSRNDAIRTAASALCFDDWMAAGGLNGANPIKRLDHARAAATAVIAALAQAQMIDVTAAPETQNGGHPQVTADPAQDSLPI